MNKPKRWTYAEITKQAQSRIEQFMAHAAQEPDMNTARVIRGWAYGAYRMWYELTMECRNESDHERLLAVTEEKSLKQDRKQNGLSL